MIIEIIATIMGLLLSFGYYPQAYKIWKKKNAESVSLVSYIIFVLGTLTWTLYGFYIKSWVIVVSFIIGVIGSSLVLILKLYYTDQRMHKQKKLRFKKQKKIKDR